MVLLRAQNLILLFLVWLVGYFSYHAMYGPRGYVMLQEKTMLLRKAENELRKCKTAQDSLGQKVQLMWQNIDPDLLEQQAWRLLRQLPADRVVIFNAPSPSAR